MKNKNSWMQTLAWVFLIVLLTVSSAVNLFAQTEPTKEKQRARISLDFFSFNNEQQQLVVTVKTRVQGYYQNVIGAEIQIFKDAVSPENVLGKVKTDEQGKAVISVSQYADTALWFTYIAVLKNHPDFRDAEKEIVVRNGYMEMDLEEVDSVKMIKIFVGAPDSTGNIIPEEEVNARAYVKRLFGLLPISDEFESTDEEGQLNIAFPPDIPGNENGNVTIVAKVDDHEEFGNLEFRQNVPWGVPIKLDKSELEKDMWLSASNTPSLFVWMVNLMLIGVFGVVVYIIFQLLRISKLGLN